MENPRLVYASRSSCIYVGHPLMGKAPHATVVSCKYAECFWQYRKWDDGHAAWTKDTKGDADRMRVVEADVPAPAREFLAKKYVEYCITRQEIKLGRL